MSFASVPTVFCWRFYWFSKHLAGRLELAWTENELNILRLSIFELKFFKKFDKKTIINEYVSLFNNFCGEPDFANGFLNNVLKSE